MILAIDIGNTHISFGLFRGRRLVRRFTLPTSMARGPGRLRKKLEAAGGRSHEAVVCSVVPWATPNIVRALRAAGCPRVRTIGRDLRVPLRNRYRHPRQVGQDRLVGAYAAWKQFKRSCIVADFGTAITIDVVTKQGEYLGGVIAPGLEISLEALATRTALLPRVELKEPPELLGRDTANSIRAGLIYGCAALCDGLVTQLKARYARDATVVATGGASPFIARHARTLQHLRPYLVLEGLCALASLKIPRKSPSVRLKQI